MTLLFYGLSQGNTPKTEEAVSLYKEADYYYNKGLRLSFLKHSDEKEETAVNRQALSGFVRFIQNTTDPKPTLDSLVFTATVKAGELEHYFDSFSQALYYYNKAIALKQRMPTLPDSCLFKPYMFAGLIYYNQNLLDSAIAYLKNAERIQANINHPIQESERLYNILGSINYQYGNYKQAKNYFQKASEVLSISNPSYPELVVNYKMNVAASLLGLEQYDSARIIYQSLSGKKGFFANQIDNQLGLIQLHSGAPREALNYFSKIRYTNYQQIGLYSDIANAYLRLKQFDSTRYYLQQATAKKETYGLLATSVDYGRILKTYGDLEKESGHYTTALHYYQQAIRQFYPAFKDTLTNDNPRLFSGAFSYINLFQTLVAKAETMEALYHQENKLDRAKLSLETYKAAFELIEYVERTYESDEARLFLTRIKQSIRSKPIDLAFSLYSQTNDKGFLTLLYNFDQQNKAAVLALNRQRNTVLGESNSPALQKEFKIKAEITRLSIHAAQVTDSVQLAVLSKRIRDYEIDLGKLQENLYPNEVLQEKKVPSLDFVQSSLIDATTALVSYHLSPEKLTTLVVSKNAVNAYQQPVSNGFDKLVQDEILAAKTPSTKPAMPKPATLHNLLLSHIPLAGLEQLIIIPDDVLAYLPFESLQDKEGKFLIQKVAVQYQFSTALLEKNKTDFSNAQTLSFAPFAQDGNKTGLAALPASEQEIKSTKGKQFLNRDATKEMFLHYSNSFPIIHLATHAVANNSIDNLSYVVFAPAKTNEENLLYAQEIYNLHLQHTGLVILSACETGAGNLIKGEGVLSLCRAFAYAGCPNIITSLWKADDLSTAYLTTRIHRYLDEGKSIAKAVQAAKIDYLNDKTINPRLKQPYYWSHLVFVGNYSPEKGSKWPWLIAAGLVVLLVFFYMLKPRLAGL